MIHDSLEREKLWTYRLIDSYLFNYCIPIYFSASFCGTLDHFPTSNWVWRRHKWRRPFWHWESSHKAGGLDSWGSRRDKAFVPSASGNTGRTATATTRLWPRCMNSAPAGCRSPPTSRAPPHPAGPPPPADTGAPQLMLYETCSFPEHIFFYVWEMKWRIGEHFIGGEGGLVGE